MSVVGKLGSIIASELALPVRPRMFWAQKAAAVFPYLGGLRARTALYRLGGAEIGHGTVLLGPLRLWGRARLRIGTHCVLNGFTAINIESDVTIGDSVWIGNDAMILTASHSIGPHERRGGTDVTRAPVVIENGCWIGARAVLLPGVTVGAGSVVAAGAVVSKDVAPDTLVGGVPAKLIRILDHNEEVLPDKLGFGPNLPSAPGL